MSMCAAPIILKVSNLSLCYKTTPVTSVKLECFSGVCVCYVCWCTCVEKAHVGTRGLAKSNYHGLNKI